MQLERLFFSLCWCKHIVIVVCIYKHGFGAILKAIQTNSRINLVWEYKQDIVMRKVVKEKYKLPPRDLRGWAAIPSSSIADFEQGHLRICRQSN